jgi:hypothetical protein
MVRSDPTLSPTIALLSAASLSLAADESASMLLVGGQSILELQISNLEHCGICRFMIEVDRVSGKLVQIADKVQNRGLAVEFIRSGADIRRFIKPDDRLWVQSEALYVAPGLLSQLLERRGTFIVTLDGHDENEAFERIDITSRWSGIAIVNAKIAYSVENLPEGWSMTSSILRQGLQEKVVFHALHQQHVQSNDLMILNTADDISRLNEKILRARVGNVDGFLEANVLAPLAIRIAPLMWRGSFGIPVIRWAASIVAGGSLVFALAEHAMMAIGLAIFAAMLDMLRKASLAPVVGNRLLHAGSLITWVLLALTVLALARADMQYSSDGIFAGLMVVGLILLSYRICLPTWAAAVLNSPALLAIVALATTPLIGFAQAMQWTGVAQLSGLVIASWTGKARLKKGVASLKSH